MAGAGCGGGNGEWEERAKRLLAGVRLVEGAGHWVNQEQVGRCAEIIVEMVESLDKLGQMLKGERGEANKS